MARYFPPPTGYRPGLVLDLRERREGGPLRPAVVERRHRVHAPTARREAVILIHGFNNHYGEAATAYHGFRRRQREDATPPLAPEALERHLADLFWPGDADWGFFDRLDFLVYPVAVGTAREAAPLLAAHLRASPTLRCVHFAAHSLGCRVALETIDDLRRGGGPAVGRVCLMAAAVPLFMVRPGGRLAAAMEYAKAVRILHSEADAVLRLAFPPGQTLAGGGEGFFPAALGLRRPPPGLPGRIERFAIGHAKHGDYWGHSTRPPAATAARHIAGFFRFGTRERTLAERMPGSAPRSCAERARP